jgi:hypothetical protein
MTHNAPIQLASNPRARSIGAILGAALAFGTIVGLYRLSANGGPGPFGLVQLLLGPDGPAGIDGNQLALWSIAPIAGGSAGWLVTPWAASRAAWAGSWMGMGTYAVASLVAPVAIFGPVAFSAPADSEWAQGPLGFLSSVGSAAMLGLIGALVMLPLLGACVFGGVIWAVVLRRLLPVEQDPGIGTWLRPPAGRVLAVTFGLFGIVWLLGAAMFGGFGLGGGEIVD